MFKPLRSRNFGTPAHGPARCPDNLYSLIFDDVNGVDRTSAQFDLLENPTLKPPSWPINPSSKDLMTKKYLYTSDAMPQLSHIDQEKLFPSINFDLVVSERNPTSIRPHRAWNGLRPMLRNGDLLAIASPSVFSYSLPMVNKQLCKLLSRGITIELGLPNLTIYPTSTDSAFQLILAYDAQLRISMSRNVTAGLATSVRGRRPSRLTIDQLPEMREMMSNQSLTMKDISKRFEVSRSTIYAFLRRNAET